MGTGRIRRIRHRWWALGALVTVVTVGALAAPDQDPAPLADPTVSTSNRPWVVSTAPEPTARDPIADSLAVVRSTPTAPPAGTADETTPSTPPAPSSALAVPPEPTATVALGLLEKIPVKGRAPRTGYDRALFGAAWTDDVTVELGHNGCDTRNDILRRDLTDVALKDNSNGCAVLSGTLQDPYTGQELPFVRGSVDAGAIQIDHVVALSDAWQKGAQGWNEQQRRNFANDPANLQATDGETNQRKGAGDAATWLPPDRGYWCTYVAQQTRIKATYGLWMTAAEKRRVGEILADCRDDPAGDVAPASTSAGPNTSAGPSTSAPPPRSAEDRPMRPTTADRGSDTGSVPAPVDGAPEYRNCADVWQRHGGPILRSDPGYRSRFDGDDDGIGCENPPR